MSRWSGTKGTSAAATTTISLHRSPAASAASVVPSRRRLASWSARAANENAARSWKALGHRSSARLDSAISGKLAAAAANGAGQRTRRAR
jgi:hypothetical protein